jgi:hypothetical protein
MEDQTGTSKLSTDQVLFAVRLGWLTVETFGRLRRYARLGYKLEEIPGDANRRFSFSDRSLSERNEFFFAVDQLQRTAARLDPDLPPCPLPRHEQLDQLLSGKLDLDACQSQLDHWSTQVWGALSTEDELTGRGFTYGGSLADTYWHTDILGPDRFAELLRPQRLEYLAARFDSIAEHLPHYAAPILHHTLYKWRDQGQINKLDTTGKKRALKQLESQAKVWHDLLFGSRNAESYLLTMDDRLITAGTIGATFLLALIVVLGVWLVTLTMSTAGRTLTAEITGLSILLPEAQTAFLDELLNWQMWSSMVATLSSVVVLLSGLVTSLSGWVIWVYRRLKEWLKLQFIYQRTYRG